MKRLTSGLNYRHGFFSYSSRYLICHYYYYYCIYGGGGGLEGWRETKKIMRNSVDLSLIPLEYTRIRQCTQCMLQYRECDHIGQLACNIHPGIRMMTSDRRIYFSCCGGLNPREGCLSIDHTDQVFSLHPIQTRLTELRLFGTSIFPFFFNDYMRMPLKETVIYQFPSKSSHQSDIINLHFAQLELCLKKYNERIIYDRVYPYDIKSDSKMEMVSKSGSGGGSHTWALNTRLSLAHIQKKLIEESELSPLYKEKQSVEESHQREIRNRCESIWKTNLNHRNNEEKYGEPTSTIKFNIISRLGQ